MNFINAVNIHRHFFDNIFTMQQIANGDEGGARFFLEEQERLNDLNKHR